MYKEHSANELKKHFKLPSDYIVEALIIYGGWDARKYKRKILSLIEKKYSIEKMPKGFLSPILSIKIENKIIWFVVEYGGAKLSEFIHFASMFGSKKNILVGTCGGLQKNMSKMQMIVPTASYSTESSAHMYSRNSKDNLFYPSKKLSEEITNRLKRKKLEVINEKTITCEAMMGETWEDIMEWSSKCFYGVEMESATVFAVSNNFKVDSAAILQVADNLIEKETVDSESYLAKKKLLSKNRNMMFKVALESVLN